MNYRYLLLSKLAWYLNANIGAARQGKEWAIIHIQIIYVNRQIYSEASSLMYSE